MIQASNSSVDHGEGKRSGMTGSGWQSHMAANAIGLSRLGSKLGCNRLDFPPMTVLHCDLRHTNVSEHCRLQTPWRGQAGPTSPRPSSPAASPLPAVGERQDVARDPLLTGWPGGRTRVSLDAAAARQ